MAPAADLGLELGGLEMRAKRLECRRRRQLDPAVVAVLAVLDSSTLFRPCPLHVDPAECPIDVRPIEGHRLAPAGAGREGDEEKRIPSWIARQAGREQRRHLLTAEPLIVPLFLLRSLSDEELEVRRRAHAVPVLDTDLPVVEPRQRAPSLLDRREGLLCLSDLEENGADLFACDEIPGSVAETRALARRLRAQPHPAREATLVGGRRRGTDVTELPSRFLRRSPSHSAPINQDASSRSWSCRHRGSDSRKTDRHRRIRASACAGAAGAARPTFADGLGVSGTRAGSRPRSRRTRVRTDFPRWRYCTNQTSNSERRTTRWFRP